MVLLFSILSLNNFECKIYLLDSVYETTLALLLLYIVCFCIVILLILYIIHRIIRSFSDAYGWYLHFRIKNAENMLIKSQIYQMLNLQYDKYLKKASNYLLNSKLFWLYVLNDKKWTAVAVENLRKMNSLGSVLDQIICINTLIEQKQFAKAIKVLNELQKKYISNWLFEKYLICGKNLREYDEVYKFLACYKRSVTHQEYTNAYIATVLADIRSIYRAEMRFNKIQEAIDLAPYDTNVLLAFHKLVQEHALDEDYVQNCEKLQKLTKNAWYYKPSIASVWLYYIVSKELIHLTNISDTALNLVYKNIFCYHKNSYLINFFSYLFAIINSEQDIDFKDISIDDRKKLELVSYSNNIDVTFSVLYFDEEVTCINKDI